MAARLSAAGVPVTVLGSAAVCAVMSRVNKVRSRLDTHTHPHTLTDTRIRTQRERERHYMNYIVDFIKKPAVPADFAAV